MPCFHGNKKTHLETVKPSLQSSFALLEQCAHFTLTEKFLDLASLLLSLNKGMDLVKGPKWWWSVHRLDKAHTRYSVNIPICFNTLGGNSVPASDLM
jgi:hypothetical protein